MKWKFLLLLFFSRSLLMDEHLQARIENGKKNLLKLGTKSLVVFIGSKIAFQTIGSTLESKTGLKNINDLSSLLTIGTTSYYMTQQIQTLSGEEQIEIQTFIHKLPTGDQLMDALITLRAEGIKILEQLRW